MHVRRALALTLAVPVLLAGCSEDPEPEPKIPETTSSSPTPTPTESETPEAESPEDFIRLKVLTDLLASVEPQGGGVMDFERLIKSAPNMGPDELKRTLQSLKASLDMGKSAVSALEAQLKRKPK